MPMRTPDLSPARRRRLRPGPWVQTAWSGHFDWTRRPLPILRLPPAMEGLRIVHLTDLHLRSFWTKAYDRLLARLAADPPDLLLMTGDFVDDKFDPRPALPVAERLCRGLSGLARLGLWATVGNHDGDLLAPRLASWGVHPLDGRAVRLTDADDLALDLIGLPGVDRHDFSADAFDALPPRPADGLRIALGHYPDQILRLNPLRPDLYFAGHTHGGQVCLPTGRPILTHDALPRDLCSGLHRVGDTWLVVSRGLGYSKYPIRLFCPAEVIEVELIRSIENVP